MHAYAIVETALARALDIPSEKHGAFRGRIKNFQRLGISPTYPGRGKRVEYTFDDAAKWAFMFELVGFGMDPMVCVRVVSDLWSMIKPEAIRPPRGLLVLKPSIMSDPQGWTATATVTDRTGLLSIAQAWEQRLMVIDLERLYARLADELDRTRDRVAA